MYINVFQPPNLTSIAFSELATRVCMHQVEPVWLPHDVWVLITILDTVLCNQIVDEEASYELDDKCVHNMWLVWNVEALHMSLKQACAQQMISFALRFLGAQLA